MCVSKLHTKAFVVIRMMRADLEGKATNPKDGITSMTVRNNKEDATEKGFNTKNWLGDERLANNGEVIGNYETSLQSGEISYKEILNEDELQKLNTEFSRLKSQCNHNLSNNA